MGKLYLISGNEDFSVKERAVELIVSLCGENPEDNTALEIIRGDDDSEKFGPVLERFIATLETPPFLSPEKIVWLKHFNKFEDALAESSNKKKKSHIDILGDFLKEELPPEPTLTVIIDGTGLDRRKGFFKICEKVCKETGGALEWFEKNDPKAKGFAQILHRKIREVMSQNNKRLDEQAVSFLAETIGGDAARLKNELDKLISFSGENTMISLEDCLRVCSRNTETLSWEFSSALASRNAAKAISMIPGIIETLEQERGSSGGRAELALISSANSEFKNLLSAKCEAERFSIPAHANADYFYSLFESRKGAENNSPFFSLHPFRAFKLWENSKRFTDVEISRAFAAIFTANKQMVTGGDMRLALETLVIKIAGT